MPPTVLLKINIKYLDPWHSGMNKLFKRKCVKTECKGWKQRGKECSQRWPHTAKTGLSIAGDRSFVLT